MMATTSKEQGRRPQNVDRHHAPFALMATTFTRRPARVLMMMLLLFLGAAATTAAAGAADTANTATARGAIVRSKTSTAALKQPQPQQPSANNNNNDDDVLLVSTLDGSVVGLDARTGKQLWTADTGAPLVSARHSAASPVNVFPAADGGLYAYHGGAGGGGQQQQQQQGGQQHQQPFVGLERLPLTLPDLVEAAPSVAPDGSMVVGSRRSRILVLDQATGVLLRTISAEGGEEEVVGKGEEAEGDDHQQQQPPQKGAPPAAGAGAAIAAVTPKPSSSSPTPSPEKVVYVGRQDYTVRSVRLDTQTETWNATYSRVFPLGNASVSAFLRGAGGGGGGTLALPPVGGATGSRSSFPRLAAASDNSIQAFDPTTGRRLWRAPLPAPPVLAQTRGGLGADFLARGGGSGLSPSLPSAAAAALDDPRVVARGGGPALAPQGESGTVLVGVLAGSLYVLPADNLLIAADETGGRGGGGGGGGSTASGAHGHLVPGLRPRGHGVFPADDVAAEAAEATATTTVHDDDADVCAAEDEDEDDEQQHHGATPRTGMALPEAPLGGLADTLGSLVCPTPALGLHSVRAAGEDGAWAAAAGGGGGQAAAAAAAAAAPLPPTLPGGPSAISLPPALPWLPDASVLAKAAQRQQQQQRQQGQQQQQPPYLLMLPPAATAAPLSPRNRAARAALTTLALMGAAVVFVMPLLVLLAVVAVRNAAAVAADEVASGAAADGGGAIGGRARAMVLALARALALQAGLLLPEEMTSPTPSSSAPSPVPLRAGGGGARPSSAGAGGAAREDEGDGAEDADGADGESKSRRSTKSGRRSRPGSAPAAGRKTDDGDDAQDDNEDDGDDDNDNKTLATRPRSRSSAVVDGDDGAVVIGRLRVGPKAIGYGSAGTIVYEGVLDGRPVAVKRLLRQFYDLARKEIGVLILSDEHPAVVRCFAMEEDREFVYLALERCKGSLSDYVATAEGSQALAPVLRSAAGTVGARAAAAAQAQAAKLVGGGGAGATATTTTTTTPVPLGAARPSPTCLALMRDVSEGLAALHERGVIHRDLKPGNVLLTSAGRAKLSDMGLSRQLAAEQSSFESHGAGGGAGGTSGWQAPEQLALRSGFLGVGVGGGAAGGAARLMQLQQQSQSQQQRALAVVGEGEGGEGERGGGGNGDDGPNTATTNNTPLNSISSARQTRAMDVFSLGCLLHYCMTGGRHPYGEPYERDSNILRGRADLRALARGGYPPEAANLVAAALARVPAARPTMPAVLDHPFWWDAERRVQFLVDVSDRVEGEDREPDTTLLASLERHARAAFGLGPVANAGGVAVASLAAVAGGGAADADGGSTTTPAPAQQQQPPSIANWGARVDARLIANLGRYRRYDFTALRDLLRVVRNKRNHFREMPPDLQAELGPFPEGFDSYFTSAFPALVMAVFCFAATSLADDPLLSKYWPCGTAALAPFIGVFCRAAGVPPAPAEVGGGGGGAEVAAGTTPAPSRLAAANGGSGGGPHNHHNNHHTSLPPLSPSSGRWASGGGTRPSDSSSWRAQPQQQQQQPLSPPSSSAAAARRSSGNGVSATAAANPGVYTPPPARPLSRGDGGAALVAPTAPNASSPATATATTPAAAAPPPVVVGYDVDPEGTPLVAPSFPSRPGRNPCDFYVKTGHCKYADDCVFDHPEEHRVMRNALNGLPYRPGGEALCAFYSKTGGCKFGPACKFHHPALVPLYAGSLQQVQQVEQQPRVGEGQEEGAAVVEATVEAGAAAGGEQVGGGPPAVAETG
jgi:serine/threonine-protein kinase/endoribonuclease IRE1